MRAALARRGIDGVTLLLLPAALFIIGLFVYPFLYGLVLSFHPKEGGAMANYVRFFSDPFLYDTVLKTLKLAVPVTVLNIALSVPVALRVRLLHNPRLLTTILVIPITLGTVLVAEGMLNYFGPRGWQRFRTILMPLLLPGLVITFCLSFVQAFSVFPSAVLLGAPAGDTRVISVAAYTAAFEEYDYPMASAIAMIMAFVQVMIVAGMLGLQSLFYRGPAGGGKG